MLINTSIKTGTYPTLFKDAIVVPVFKGGRKDREDPASYRPISVLPALSKVLETIILDQFMDYLDENNLLPPAQHGFRRGHSTVTAKDVSNKFIRDILGYSAHQDHTEVVE